MKYNRDWAIAERGRNPRLRFRPFWGHQPAKDGSVTASCFSQWWYAPFTVDGNLFHTAEHWMMHGKALLFGDHATAAEILEATSPQAAKALGRQVAGFTDAQWNADKYDIVLKGSVEKFRAHPDLRDFLLGTGDDVLVEASPYDRVWGIGMGASNPDADNPSNWRGQNLLGFALMEARDILRAEA